MHPCQNGRGKGKREEHKIFASELIKKRQKEKIKTLFTVCMASMAKTVRPGSLVAPEIYNIYIYIYILYLYFIFGKIWQRKQIEKKKLINFFFIFLNIFYMRPRTDVSRGQTGVLKKKKRNHL